MKRSAYIALEDSIDAVAVSLNVYPLKTKQREAVEAFMKGNDVFVAYLQDMESL